MNNKKKKRLPPGYTDKVLKDKDKKKIKDMLEKIKREDKKKQ